ncbi:MAG: hypothetical protein J7647_23295 [Cyanobacteria bacterium SBLK]|nr:hypothetical protein [Cyanobacteria bacterium SBLK]
MVGSRKFCKWTRKIERSGKGKNTFLTQNTDYTAAWERSHAKFYEKNGGDEKLAKIGVLIDNTVQGYQIDKKTADEYNITNLEQLKDPEIAKLFDRDGNGKANVTGCNPGWVCEGVIEHHLDAYGLRDTVEHDQGEYGLLIADMMTRHKHGKNLGFAIDRVRITANREFINENPAAKKLFELIEIPIELVGLGESHSPSPKPCMQCPYMVNCAMGLQKSILNL